MSRRIHRTELALLLGTIVLAATSALLLFTHPLASRRPKPRPSLELRVADQKGRIRVDWDTSDPAVRSAQGATLEVEDGGVLNRYPVEPGVLRSGGLDYVRRTEDVLLTLTLYHDGRPGLQSTVRRVRPVEASLRSSDPKTSTRTRRR